ncbi:MAG: DMT family transporter [Sciscionella sp.]|nr:DMT family transporter [Sciscionella sp.]
MNTTSAMFLVAVPAAVAGAASMGLASAAQAKATHEVPDTSTLDPRLLVNLVRRPLWLLGTIGTIAGLGLQVLALGFGPLLLVQPLLVTALLFAAVFAAWMRRHQPDRIVVVGALMCVAGLAALLLIAQPGGDSNTLAPVSRLLPLAVVFAAVVLVCLVVSIRSHHPARALPLALATGVLYGVTAGLMKVVSGQFRIGFGEPFTHWALYVVCVVGPMGFLLSQNTFQQGSLVSPALAVITTVDPLVGVSIGVNWFGEDINTSGMALLGEVLSTLVIIGGIVLLARRGAQLMHDDSVHVDGVRVDRVHVDREPAGGRKVVDAREAVDMPASSTGDDDGFDGLAFSADGR